MSSFNQYIPLDVTVRGILQEYPEGSGCLKEAIQNSDDAAATEVSFWFVEDTSGEPITHPFWQAPALYIYNSGVFSDDDWISLQTPSDSRKLKDRTTTGRFGIGFNAFYHVTETPAILSGSRLVILDPQAKHLDSLVTSGTKNTDKLFGVTWDLKKDAIPPVVAKSFFFHNLATPYRGTVIRLPLRSPQLAQTSKLTRHPYSKDDVMRIFELLSKELRHLLIFLKHVRRLTVKTIELGPNGRVAAETELYGVQIQPRDQHEQELVERRTRVARLCAKNDVYEREVLTDNSQRFVYEMYVAHWTSTQAIRTDRWKVWHSYGSRALSVISRKHPDLKLIPWASLATIKASNGDHSTLLRPDEGKLFCFLPLPINTGVSFHINGWFSLHSNRRSLFGQDGDVEGDGKVKAIWNKFLFEKLVMSMLLDAVADQANEAEVSKLTTLTTPAQKCKFVFDNIWPRASSQLFAMKDYALQSLFFKMGATALKVPFYSKNHFGWSSLKGLVCCKEGEDVELVGLLQKYNVWMGILPGDLYDGFKDLCRGLFTSQAVRVLLGEFNVNLRVSEETGTLEQHIALVKLAIGTVEIQKLSGLTLLPLATRKEFGRVEVVKANQTVAWNFIAGDSERELLANTGANIIHPEGLSIATNLKARAAKYKADINIANLDTSHIAKLIKAGVQLSINQCKLFWTSFAPKFSVADAKSLANCALVPVRGHAKPQPLTTEVFAISGLAPEVEQLIVESLNYLVWDSSLVIISPDVCKTFGVLHQLSGNHITLIARWIATQASRTKNTASLLASAVSFAEVVHTNWALLNGQDKQLLGSLAWLPCGPAKSKLPAWSGSQIFHKPQDLFIDSNFNLIGCIAPIVSKKVELPKFREGFGWDELPPWPRVLDNLYELVQFSKSIPPPIPSDIVLEVEDATTATYHYLAKLPPQHLTDALARLKQTPAWIWVPAGSVFVPLAQIATNSHPAYQPHLFATPDSIKAISDKLQVAPDFTDATLLSLLRFIATKSRGAKLSGPDLECALTLLNNLASALSGKDLTEDIPLVSQFDVLIPRASAVFNDTAEPSSEPTLLHSRISKKTAVDLGVRLRSSVLLAHAVSPIDSGLGANLSEFGQKVDICDRIRNIVESYSNPLDLIKEAIQNSDDAKASSISFMLDFRHHKKEKLVSTDMEAFQGPALVIYNNAQFSEEDIKNIQRIGAGAKEGNFGTIGRFGEGVNVFYSITDVLTFVTRGHLYIMDPHEKYGPKTKARYTGVGIKLEKRILDQFPDQFEPYAMALTESFRGTYIRLPLRTAEMAKASKIKQRPTTTTDIQKVFGLIYQNGFSHMLPLFLRSVREINFWAWYEGEPSATVLAGISTIFENQVPPVPEQRRRLEKQAERFNTSRSVTDLKDVVAVSFQVKTEVFVSEAGQSFLGVKAQRKPASDGDSLAGDDQDDFEPHTGQNGKVFLVSHKLWGISEQVGTKDSEVGAFLAEAWKNGLQFLPWAGVAARVDPGVYSHATSSNNHAQSLDRIQRAGDGGGVFCFLPLPLKSTLPVHANGYWEITRDRTSLVDSPDAFGADRFKSQWNRKLSIIVTECYLSLLRATAPIVQPTAPGALECYWGLWPNSEGNKDSLWRQMSTLFFKQAADYRIFWTRGMSAAKIKAQLCTAKEAGKFFQDPNFAIPKVILALIESGMSIMDAPPSIFASLTGAGVQPPAVSAESARNQLRDHFQKIKLPPTGEIKRFPLRALRDVGDFKELLFYTTSDFNGPQPTTFKGPHKALLGLPLIVLEDNKRYAVVNAQQKFCLAADPTIRDLFIEFCDIFVSQDLPHAINHSKLLNIYSSSEMANDLLGHAFSVRKALGQAPSSAPPAAPLAWKGEGPSRRWILALIEYLASNPKVLETLNDNWPIVPAYSDELYALKGTNQAISAINMQDQEVVEICKSLGCPISTTTLLPAAFYRPFDILSIAMTAKPELVASLPVESILTLLEWLDTHSKALEGPKSAQAAAAVKKWPIFLKYTASIDTSALSNAHRGRSYAESLISAIRSVDPTKVQFVSLDSPNILPMTIPPNLPFRTSGKQFLHLTAYSRLYAALGVKDIELLEYLKTHLLPNVDFMPNHEVEVAMNYIRANWVQISASNGEFPKLLKELRFLPPTESTRQEAEDAMSDHPYPGRQKLADLKSPSDPFLATFLAVHSPFPPAPYNSPEWVEFFNNHSMLDKTISVDLILRAAKLVESCAQNGQETLPGTHKSIVDGVRLIRSAIDALYPPDTTLSASLPTIRFLPITPFLTHSAVPAATLGRAGWTALSECCLLSSAKLCWTQAPLVDPAFIPATFLPLVEANLDHSTVSSQYMTLVHSEEGSYPPTLLVDTFRELFAWMEKFISAQLAAKEPTAAMQEFKECITGSPVMALIDRNFAGVDELIVKFPFRGRVFFEKPKWLSSYMAINDVMFWVSQADKRAYFNLFNLLGVRESPTFDDWKSLFASYPYWISEEPNHFTFITEGVFPALCDLAIPPSSVMKLIDREKHLIPSNRLIRPPAWLSSTSNSLQLISTQMQISTPSKPGHAPPAPEEENLPEGVMFFVHSKVPQVLLDKLGVLSFSRHMHKKINPRDLHPLEDNSAGARLSAVIRSPEFATAVMRVYAKQLTNTDRPRTYREIQSILDSKLALLEPVNVVFVESLDSMSFTLQDQTVPREYLHPSMIYLFQPDTHTLFLDGKQATMAAVAACINEILDGLVPEYEESFLKRCLEKTPASIASLLDEEKIPPLEGETEFEIGSRLLSSDIARLNLRPRAPYAKEIVAYRDEEGKYRFGRVVGAGHDEFSRFAVNTRRDIVKEFVGTELFTFTFEAISEKEHLSTPKATPSKPYVPRAHAAASPTVLTWNEPVEEQEDQSDEKPSREGLREAVEFVEKIQKQPKESWPAHFKRAILSYQEDDSAKKIHAYVVQKRRDMLPNLPVEESVQADPLFILDTAMPGVAGTADGEVDTRGSDSETEMEADHGDARPPAPSPSKRSEPPTPRLFNPHTKSRSVRLADVYAPTGASDLLLADGEPASRATRIERPTAEDLELGNAYLTEAETDLAAGHCLASLGFFGKACFCSQQALEKALRGFLYLKGEDSTDTHHIREFYWQCIKHQEASRLKSACLNLQRHYIASRYPNASSTKPPSSLYQASDATEALSLAKEALAILNIQPKAN